MMNRLVIFMVVILFFKMRAKSTPRQAFVTKNRSVNFRSLGVIFLCTAVTRINLYILWQHCNEA